MDKVTFFDVEYANSKNKSICQIGLMCEDYNTGEPVYPERNIYIDPEDGFDDVCVRIHGISESKVKGSPSFSDVWPDIEKYFVNAVIIGHNVASADIDALVKNLRRCNIDIPEMYYICTYELAKKYVPNYCVPDYSMTSLCNFFDVDIDSEHDAFDDACACSDLFRALVNTYEIDVQKHVKKYVLKDTVEYVSYVSNPVLRKSISNFYGVIRGFSIDGIINEQETEYIRSWRDENKKYSTQTEILEIISVIDRILEDGVVTLAEIADLQCVIKNYLDIVATSPVTLATQILDGILKGITVDSKISEIECVNLRQWLYDNIYLSDHFPFDQTLAMLDSVLADSVVTEDEMEYMNSVINDILNPVECLRTQINTVEGQHVCLSGNFAYGAKSKVEAYIVEHGGIVDKGVTRKTDILLIGDYECQSYSNGTYGTKVKKAMEYNEKGCHILIAKESDFLK